MLVGSNEEYKIPHTDFDLDVHKGVIDINPHHPSEPFGRAGGDGGEAGSRESCVLRCRCLGWCSSIDVMRIRSHTSKYLSDCTCMPMHEM